MSVYLTALGCRLNEAELQMWADKFRLQGLTITPKIEEARLMVINTCAVTGEAARKSRQTIRKMHRKNPQANLIVTGCYASLEKQQAESILGVDLIVSNQDKEKLPELSKELLEWKAMPYAASQPDEAALFVRNRERAFIKIQDGCRYRCTYCIVTIARGEEVSRSIDDLIEEIRQLEKQQVKEIVLTGVHVGGYGSDLNSSLSDLVKAILAQTNIPRIRFASVEPWDLPDDFFELFKDKRLMPHMHLPIQSGSNAILRKMSRRCKTESFLALVKRAREIVPDFNVTTDIIVGFPGETEADFELSKKIIGEANFGHIHIFSYSNREGTKAASLPNQVAADIKKQRSQSLHQIAEANKHQLMQKMLGKKQSILFEGQPTQISENQYQIFGYTENYHKVVLNLKKPMMLSNQILCCEVVGFDMSFPALKVKLIDSLENHQQAISVKML